MAESQSVISGIESSSEMDVDFTSASQIGYDTDTESQQISHLERLDMNETRNMLASMIETCEELDQKPSFQHDEDAELAKQVKQGKLIFDAQFGHNFKKPATPMTKVRNRSAAGSPDIVDGERNRRGSCHKKSLTKVSLSSQSTELSQIQDKSVNANTKPSDLLLLFKHTKLCTAVFRKRVERMGGHENIFSVEDYVSVLRSWGQDEEEETDTYSVLQAFKKQCRGTLNAFKTTPGYFGFLGGFNQKEYIAECQERERGEEEKQEKLTPKPKNKSTRFDKNATIHEQLDASQVPANASQAPGGKETNAHRKLLVELCKKDGVKAVGLAEFIINKDSVFETMRNIFSTSFCIRDGSMALDVSDSLSDMKISPCALKKQADPENDMTARSQCIVSFTAKQLRELQAIAEGENAVSPPNQNANSTTS